jgi:hypothetical protein
MGKGKRKGGTKAAGSAAKGQGAKKPPGPQAAWQAFRESVKDKPLKDLFDPKFPEQVGKDGKTVRPFELYSAARAAQGQACGTIEEELARLSSREGRKEAGKSSSDAQKGGSIDDLPGGRSSSSGASKAPAREIIPAGGMLATVV